MKSSNWSTCGMGVVVVLLALGFCSPKLALADQAKSKKEKSAPKITEAIALLHPTTGNQCMGIVRFTQKRKTIKVVADIEGLTPNQKHAIHIHEFGDCSDLSGKSAGGHYNPEGHSHGLPPNENRHAGDLGNLQADADGKAHFELTVGNITIAGSKNNPILGRSIIIHALPDDGGQPTGNAGARIACGVIGIANPGGG